MRRLSVPGGLVQKDGLGQSDVPRRYLDPEEREMPLGGGRCSKSVTWAPHGITAVSSGQEEWSGRLRHQGKTCCGAWGDAESFQLPDPVLVPGGPGAPVLSWGFQGAPVPPGLT